MNARRIYLSAAEVRVLNEALAKWHNWSYSDMESWEDDAYGKLSHKLYEHEEFEPPTQPTEH